MRIFLSYRRDDASAWAGRLHDALAAQFDERNIFQDVTAVRPGQDFRKAIEGALDQSDVVLVVIGPRWLTEATADGEQRLASPDDYVHIEVVAAIEHGKQVVPVLVGGATMPTTAELPEGLEALGMRQAVVLRDASWRQDVNSLIRSLRGERESVSVRRRHLIIGIVAAALAGAVIAGAAAWTLRGESEGGGGEGGPTAPAGSADTGSGSDDAGTLACTTPSSGWSDLGVTGSTDVGDPGWHFEVWEGHEREEDGRWQVVLRVDASQNTQASQFHYPNFYELVLEGVPYEPYCFDVVSGQDPLSPGAHSEALVGFDLPADTTGGFALDLDTGGEFGRIELMPQ